MKKSFVKKVRKITNTGSLAITIPIEVGLEEGKVYQFHVEELEGDI